MTERFTVREFGLVVRYLPARILRGGGRPTFGYGSPLSDPWHRFRPKSVSEWLAYLYERGEYDWVQTSKRPGDGDLLLQHFMNGELKEVEVKHGRDGLRTSQLRSLATRPSSQNNRREVVCLEEADYNHRMDSVPCPRSDRHSSAAGADHCEALRLLRRPDSLEVKSILNRSAFRGPLEELHVQDCLEMPTLAVEISNPTEFHDVYDELDELFPECCYFFMGTPKDHSQGGIKLYTTEGPPRQRDQ